MQAHRPLTAMDGSVRHHSATDDRHGAELRSSDHRVLRKDLDHALTRTLAFLYPLLLLQSVPSYIAQRDPASVLAPVVLALATLPCALLIIALRKPSKSSLLLLLAASLYPLIAAVEAIEARHSLPQAYLPWLLVVAPVFIPSLALGARTVRTWAIGNTLGLATIVLAYTPRLPLGLLLMVVLTITGFSFGAFAGIRTLRRRADEASAAERAAHTKYDETQRRLSLEQERVRTDALIHDSLLNALLGAVAAATVTAARPDAVRRAHEAITVLDGANDGAEQEGIPDPSASIGDLLRHELRLLRNIVELRIEDGASIEAPPLVRDALVSAALQAVNNSLKHAGDGARRIVTLEQGRKDGVLITVYDDGRGFDPNDIAAERLGVRVSILKRTQTVGGSAQVLSSPGRGTTIILAWSGDRQAARADPLPSSLATRRLVDA